MLRAQAQRCILRAIEGASIQQGKAASPRLFILADLLDPLPLLLPSDAPVVIPLLNLVLTDLATLPEQVEGWLVELHSSVLLRRLR